MNQFLFNRDKSETLVYFGLIIFYLIFFFNLIINSGSNWSLLKLFIVLLPVALYKNKVFSFDKWILITILPAFVFFYLNEIILHNNLVKLDLFDNRFYEKRITQFLFILAFTLMPTLICKAKFNNKVFFKIIMLATALSVFYNGYWNLKLSFDRGLLAAKYDMVILYDYSIIAITLVALCYCIQLKNKYSYVFMSICLINITLIILHGSRGAWLGVPVGLLIIFMIYYKIEKQKVLFGFLASSLITLGLIYIPNSPVMSRISEFKQDTSLMENKDYNSSVGNRIALFNFSIDKFKESPIVGVGVKQLAQDICDLSKQKVIPECSPHMHNVYLQELLSRGLLGFLALILMFFTPLICFLTALLRKPNANIRLICTSGITFTIYFMICGLTDYVFFMMFTTMLYFLCVCTLMSFIYQVKKFTLLSEPTINKS